MASPFQPSLLGMLSSDDSDEANSITPTGTSAATLTVAGPVSPFKSVQGVSRDFSLGKKATGPVVLPCGLLDEGGDTGACNFASSVGGSVSDLPSDTRRRNSRSAARAYRAVAASTASAAEKDVGSLVLHASLNNSPNPKSSGIAMASTTAKPRANSKSPSSTKKIAKGKPRVYLYLEYCVDDPPFYPWLETPRPIDSTMMAYIWANDPKPWLAPSGQYWKAVSNHLFSKSVLRLTKPPRSRGLLERFEYLMVFVRRYIQAHGHRTGGNEPYSDYLKKLTELDELLCSYNTNEHKQQVQADEEKLVTANMLEQMLGKRGPILVAPNSKSNTIVKVEKTAKAKTPPPCRKKERKPRATLRDAMEDHRNTLLLADAIQKSHASLVKRLDTKKTTGSITAPVDLVQVCQEQSKATPSNRMENEDSEASSGKSPILAALKQQEQMLQAMNCQQILQQEKIDKHNREVIAQQTSIAASLSALVGIMSNQSQGANED